MPEGQIIEKFEEYGIKVTAEPYCLTFQVKKIVGETLHPPPAGLWLYSKPSEDCTLDTTDFDEGELFLSGQIKWDGCSDWDFHTDVCMAHFCGRKDATSLGRLMDHLYQLAEERLETYNKELAE